MATFTTTAETVRFTDTDGAVSFTASRPSVTFTAGYQSVTGAGATDLDDLTDVTITAAASGDILRHNGTAWVDTPGAAHFAAANTAPVTVNFRVACSAVDGTATVFEIVVPERGASASGVVPAGWSSVFTVPDVATLEGLLALNSLTSATVLVVSEPGVYQFDADAIAEPWTDVTPDDGVDVLLATDASARYWFAGGTLRYLTVTDLIGGVTGDDLDLDATQIAKTGAGGLDFNQLTVDGVLENHEGILDNSRYGCAFFDTTVIDPASYGTAPVTQPTPDGGAIVLGADVLVLTAVDTTKRGLWHIDAIDGTWSQYAYPDILIGNKWSFTCNAEGAAGDGVKFEWIDEDPTIVARKSGATPGSSQPPEGETWADGRNGRWIKYTSTVDVVSNVAQDRILGRITSGTGDSEELTAAQVRTLLGNPVVGGQDEGPVVTATTATTMLDAPITLTGAAGDHFTVTVGGRFNNQTGSPKRPTITVLLGATTVATLKPASAISSSANDRLFRATIDIRVNAATDINVVADGQIVASVFEVSTGTATGDISAGLDLDIRGAVESGGSQEVQVTQVSVIRFRA